MISEKKVLGLIPARGGSKGVPGKNIRSAAGKPLIAWTIECALASSVLDRVILSSDDDEIIKISREYGCEVPFVRPAELAADQTDSISVARHALEALEEKYDYLVLLQPTSPLRIPADIDEAVRLCIKKNVSSCVSVCESDKHPNLIFSIDEKNKFEPLFSSKIPSRRQDAPPAYVLNGAVYVSRCDSIMAGDGFISEDTVAWVMPKIRSIDIDTELDFTILDALHSKGQ